jgi:hypothetical protein
MARASRNPATRPPLPTAPSAGMRYIMRYILTDPDYTKQVAATAASNFRGSEDTDHK